MTVPETTVKVVERLWRDAVQVMERTDTFLIVRLYLANDYKHIPIIYFNDSTASIQRKQFTFTAQPLPEDISDKLAHKVTHKGAAKAGPFNCTHTKPQYMPIIG